MALGAPFTPGDLAAASWPCGTGGFASSSGWAWGFLYPPPGPVPPACTSSGATTSSLGFESDSLAGVTKMSTRRCGAEKGSITLSGQWGGQGGTELLQEEQPQLWWWHLPIYKQDLLLAVLPALSHRLPSAILLNNPFSFLKNRIFLKKQCATSTLGCWLGFLEGHSLPALLLLQGRIDMVGCNFLPSGEQGLK